MVIKLPHDPEDKTEYVTPQASDFVVEGVGQSVPYPRSPKQRVAACGYTSIRVLPLLTGHKWDNVALGFVHGLRPSWIRVVTGMRHLDARTWRVTVEVDANNVITSISQEVEVYLPDGIPHGSGLHAALNHGMDSDVMKWEKLDCEVQSYSAEGVFKLMKDGSSVPHPLNPKSP